LARGIGKERDHRGSKKAKEEESERGNKVISD